MTTHRSLILLGCSIALLHCSSGKDVVTLTANQGDGTTPPAPAPEPASDSPEMVPPAPGPLPAKTDRQRYGIQPDAVCDRDCTDSEYLLATEQALDSMQMDIITAYQDPASYLDLFLRVAALTGHPLDFDAVEAKASLSSLGQLQSAYSDPRLDSFQDPDSQTGSIMYCGPGSYDLNTIPPIYAVLIGTPLTLIPRLIPQVAKALYPGTCLNRACFDHDRCYADMKNPGKCVFSARAQPCDATFVLALEKCQGTLGPEGLPVCDWKCSVIKTFVQLAVTAQSIALQPDCTCADVGAECCSPLFGDPRCGGGLKCVKADTELVGHCECDSVGVWERRCELVQQALPDSCYEQSVTRIEIAEGQLQAEHGYLDSMRIFEDGAMGDPDDDGIFMLPYLSYDATTCTIEWDEDSCEGPDPIAYGVPYRFGDPDFTMCDWSSGLMKPLCTWSCSMTRLDKPMPGPAPMPMGSMP